MTPRERAELTAVAIGAVGGAIVIGVLLVGLLVLERLTR